MGISLYPSKIHNLTSGGCLLCSHPICVTYLIAFWEKLLRVSLNHVLDITEQSVDSKVRNLEKIVLTISVNAALINITKC